MRYRIRRRHPESSGQRPLSVFDPGWTQALGNRPDSRRLDSTEVIADHLALVAATSAALRLSATTLGQGFPQPRSRSSTEGLDR